MATYSILSVYNEVTGKWGVVKRDDVSGEITIISENGEKNIILISNPPVGKYKVINIYVDPITGKLEAQWDDVPTP